MPLACLDQVLDRDLLPEIFRLHDAYSRQIPDVAANYVRVLRVDEKSPKVLHPNFYKKGVKLGESGQVSQTRELILARCSFREFRPRSEILKGLQLSELERVKWMLCNMQKRGEIEKVGLGRSACYRLK